MAPETPRGVSSRLLSMKFMQRAVASASSAGSPDSETHSSKKRKMDHSPSGGRIDLNFSQAAVKAAIDDQEAQRQSALAQHVGSDTHWVLDNVLAGSQAKPAKPPMNIVYVGYGDFDSANESGDNEDVPAKGRTSTSSYKKSKSKPQASVNSLRRILISTDRASQENKSRDNSDTSDDSSDEDLDEPNEASGRKRKLSTDSPNFQSERSRSRSRSKSRQSAEGAKAKEFRDKRKKKEVRLNKLTSISGGGGIGGGDKQFGSGSKKNLTCYKCQKPGHFAAECPNPGSSRGRSRR